LNARTLPHHYAPPRTVNGRTRTCRLIHIGIAHLPSPHRECSDDALRLQRALLAKPSRAACGHRYIVPASLAGIACWAAFWLLGWVR
jgi:hypothetical protein